MNRANREDGDEAYLEELLETRKAYVRAVRQAASRGDPLAGALSELERLAAPFHLGIDESLDFEDIDEDNYNME